MKKFTKFIGIFLALALVIGLIPVVGAVDPETPTAPAAPTGAILQGTTYEVVSPTRIETLFGFYEDGTGADEDTFMDCQDGACVTDGWFGRAGYSECTSADGLIALNMMVDDFINLGSIEIVCKDAAHAAAKFDVQVMGDADWETVVSVEANPFTDSLTKTFTFDAVETDTIRILVYEVATDDQCYFNEVTLFEAATGDLKTVLDLDGKATAGDAHASSNNNWAIDGDKSTFLTGSTVTVGLGEATAIDGFNLYHYRSNSFPNNITVNIQKTEGGAFELLGTFATGFTSGSPQDSLYVTFDQTYMAYAVQFVSDVWGYQNDYELWQYQREGTEPTPTEEPTPAPTEEPTPAPTEEPTPAPTEEPTPAPTEEPSEEPTEPVGPAPEKQKVDLTGTVVGACSGNAATATDYSEYSWWSDGRPDWKPLGNFVDNNLSTYFSFGASAGERSDLYLDLSKGGTGSTAVGEFTIYHSSQGNVPSIMVVLVLEDGTEWTKTYETNWEQFAGNLALTETFTENKNAVGMYIWQNGSDEAHFGDIEIYEFVASSEPTTPPTEEPTQAPTEEPTQAPTEEPTEPATGIPEAPVVAPGTNVVGTVKTGNVYKIVSPTKLTTVFGYYDAQGAFVDGNDGACVTDGWYGRAGYSECTTANGTIGLIMTMDEAATIGAIEMVGNNAQNNPVDFEIQVMVNGEWVTVVDVNEDPFTAGMTKTFTFPAVETAQVRVMINAVAVASNQCYFNEVSLFEVVDGKLYNKVDLTGRVTESDAHSSHPIVNLIDGDKSNIYLGNTTTINLTEGGQPTSIDGFALYHYRGGQAQPGSVTIAVQKTEGGEFEAIGTFSTNWTNTAPIDSLFVEFDQTQVAYAMKIVLDSYAYANEFELFQYQQEPAPVEPPVDPTEPTEPEVEPTEPEVEPTEPEVEPTEPEVEPTEPEVEPTEPEVEPTEPEEEPTEPSEPTDEPEEPTEPEEEPTEPSEPTDEPEEPSEPEEDLPEVPELPGLPDITDIEATIDLIYDLDPSDYTAESYENLIIVVKQVNKIITGGFNQTMINRANEMLAEALAALVPVNGGDTDVPGGDEDGDVDGDEDLPAPTGDIALTVLTGMMSLSAIGGAVVIGKKKFF